MFTHLRISRKLPLGMTGLELCGPDSELHLKFLSRMSKSQRRAVVLSFIRQLRPWIDRFTDAAIDHSKDGVIRARRARRKGEKILRSRVITPENTEFAFGIRMRRLELGLTQGQLAIRARIDRSHLSDIERGVYKPRMDTLRRLEAALDDGHHGEKK